MNNLPSELVAHVLSFLSLPDRSRLALCSATLYEEKILEIQTCRALFAKRPAYLADIKNMVVKEMRKHGYSMTERPNGVIMAYNAEARQTMFMSEEIRITGLTRRTSVLHNGQVQAIYLDSGFLSKQSPIGECKYGAFYLTEKGPSIICNERREKRINRTMCSFAFVLICLVTLGLYFFDDRI